MCWLLVVVVGDCCFVVVADKLLLAVKCQLLAVCCSLCVFVVVASCMLLFVGFIRRRLRVAVGVLLAICCLAWFVSVMLGLLLLLCVLVCCC